MLPHLPDSDGPFCRGGINDGTALGDLHLAGFNQPLGGPAGRLHQAAPIIVTNSAGSLRRANGGRCSPGSQKVQDGGFQLPVNPVTRSLPLVIAVTALPVSH